MVRGEQQEVYLFKLRKLHRKDMVDIATHARMAGGVLLCVSKNDTNYDDVWSFGLLDVYQRKYDILHRKSKAVNLDDGNEKSDVCGILQDIAEQNGPNIRDRKTGKVKTTPLLVSKGKELKIAMGRYDFYILQSWDWRVKLLPFFYTPAFGFSPKNVYYQIYFAVKGWKTRWELYHKQPRCERLTTKAINHILPIRCRLLNRSFTWTAENHQKMLWLSNQFIEAFEKAWKEAEPIARALEKRVLDSDKELENYTVSVKVVPVIDSTHSNERSSLNIHLQNVLIDNFIGHEISHSEYGMGDCWNPRELNRNDGAYLDYLRDEFQGEPLCYQLYELLKTEVWSYSDIMRIDRLDAEIKVIRKNRIYQTLQGGPDE
jgi:hypothetical protein